MARTYPECVVVKFVPFAGLFDFYAFFCAFIHFITGRVAEMESRVTIQPQFI